VLRKAVATVSGPFRRNGIVMKTQLKEFHHAARMLLRGRGTPLAAVLVLVALLMWCLGVFTRLGLKKSGVPSETRVGRLPMPAPWF